MQLNELSNITFFKKGGQKEVYTADHPALGKVAYKKIKIIDPVDLERMKREIRAVTLIDSENIPKIYYENCDEPGITEIYIVEQFIEGQTIREKLSRGEKFDTKFILEFLDTMLRLSVRAEALNIIHRDIKPDNIIIDTLGKIWMLDYGIARHIDMESLTQSAQHFGLFTLGYASTEQFRNLKKEIDIRADLFSIGIVAHELLTGENIYRKNTFDPLAILKNMEKYSPPPLRIEGDTLFQLSAFICMIGDHRRTRRPRTAVEAQVIFNNVRGTVRI